jgi:hypothetical protein
LSGTGLCIQQNYVGPQGALAQRDPPFTDDKEAGYAGACRRAAPCADLLGSFARRTVIYSARFQIASARPPVDKARAVNVSWSPVIAKMRF